MTQMLFFLRFKTQLRRTRPELISRLEKSVSGAVAAAGGKITGERRLLAVSFDENALGFWLDILVLIESILKNLDAAAGDLYGYALVLCRDMEENSAERVCRFLAAGSQGGGVWLDTMAKKGLLPYAVIDKSDSLIKEGRVFRPQDRALVQGFARLKTLKNFSGLRQHCFPLEDTIQRALTQSAGRNAVLLGPEFSGKRHGIYRFYQKICPAPAAGEVSPLIIRFDTGGLACLADAWTPRLRSLIAGSVPGEILEELDSLETTMFRDRLRDEIPSGGIKQGRYFFRLLLETFVPAVKKRGAPPLIILENIHRADEAVARIFLEVHAAFPGKQDILILGTCSDEAPDIEERLKFWGGIFPRVIKLNTGDISGQETPNLPPDLEEISYALALLGRFFPGALFPRLFEDEGKNPAMLSRALSLLSCLGLVDTPEDPRPRINGFLPRMDRALGSRKEKILIMTRNRLLDWVDRNRLNPCFRLLEALAELGARTGDDLILKSISSDIINGTYRGIEKALAENRLAKITGPERVEAVRFIIKTHKALYHGDERMIHTAFQEVPPDCSFSPVLKAQILANLSAFYLGSRDIGSAGETVKEGILLSQGKNSAVLAQSYRLFSLINIFRQRIGETIDYLGFAVDNADKFRNSHELVVSAYYAASAHFLFGNISRAQRLALQAETEALVSGDNEWADRSRFLQGRLWFEIGHYQEALEIFETLGNNAAGQREKEALLAAWAYRAKVYLRSSPLPRPAGECPDTDLFEIEAAYLAGDYEKTAELSGALAGLHHAEYFLYTEQPDWHSGFAQAELLLFPRVELWNRMVSVYHALALCRLSPGGGEEALHSMQRIIRDERLAETDPWDAFYFFAWYRILEETRAAQVDMNTAVSMAFKRLQRRASRIDDIAIRRDFLSLPRWNSDLSLAAKEYKLI
jgi:tetratricopeptide (TPR) repeat protein